MKKGISLIVLVITIIVMIILASTIILNLSGINIIERAKQAVKESNRKQIETLAQTIWSDGYLENKSEASIKEEIVSVVGKNKADDFNIVVTNMGVIVENFPEGWEKSVSEIVKDVPIPKGFVVSPYEGENDPNEGLVIYALKEDEIDKGVYDITKTDIDHQYSLENRNQFVWVPVSKTNFATEFVRDRFGFDMDKLYNTTDRNTNWYSNVLGSATAEKGYFWEVEVDDKNMPKTTQSNMKFMSEDTLAEVIEMYASVKKYGGFYIARYEAGASDIDDTTKFGRSEEISITMGKYPYNGVPWATSNTMNLDEGGAVELAREFYKRTNTKYGVVSTLTYGVQWDRTVAWMKSIKGESFNLLNSTEYGHYSNTTLVLSDFNKNSQYTSAAGSWTSTTNFTTRNGYYRMTTGALLKSNNCNIYDMAGNMSEWTMESNETLLRVIRGGDSSNTGATCPLVFRGKAYSNGSAEHIGFRPSLYIK